MRLIDADRIKKVFRRNTGYDYADIIDMQPTTVNVLDKIRAEIKRPLEIERYFDTDSAKAQAIALNWCIEIIDKYLKGEE